MGLPAFHDGGCLAYLSAHSAAERQREQEARLSELTAGYYSSFLNSPDYKALFRQPKRAPRGSREFRDHHGQSVCAYCRSAA